MAHELNLRLDGEGGSLPIVLLHGIPCGSGIWGDVIGDLAEDHLVVTADLLGFGASDRPVAAEGLWVDSQAAALGAALDRAGIGRAVVAGHDFGAPVGLRLAAREPDRVAGFALLAGNAFADTPIPFPIRMVTWPLLGGLAARLLFSRPSLRLMLRQGSSVDLESPELLGDRAQVRASATIFAHALRNLDAYTEVERDLRALEVPLLVGWGDRDPFFAVEQAHRTAAAGGARPPVLHAGAGHFLPAERPTEIARDLRNLAAEALESAA